MTGPPGTAKTFLSTYAALRLYRSGRIEKIYYVKPIVSVFGDNGLGFLKGDTNEKTLPHLSPVIDSLRGMATEGYAKSLVEQKKVEFIPFEHLRGRSLDYAFVIADEMQNATPESVFTTLPRIGRGTKISLCGDVAQRDLDPRYGKSGLADAVNRLRGMDNFCHVHFQVKDIVRHGFVRDVVLRYLDWYDSDYVKA